VPMKLSPNAVARVVGVPRSRIERPVNGHAAAIGVLMRFVFRQYYASPLSRRPHPWSMWLAAEIVSVSAMWFASAINRRSRHSCRSARFARGRRRQRSASIRSKSSPDQRTGTACDCASVRYSPRSGRRNRESRRVR
jgi:hypothetical protein